MVLRMVEVGAEVGFIFELLLRGGEDVGVCVVVRGIRVAMGLKVVEVDIDDEFRANSLTGVGFVVGSLIAFEVGFGVGFLLVGFEVEIRVGFEDGLLLGMVEFNWFTSNIRFTSSS